MPTPQSRPTKWRTWAAAVVSSVEENGEGGTLLHRSCSRRRVETLKHKPVDLMPLAASGRGGPSAGLHHIIVILVHRLCTICARAWHGGSPVGRWRAFFTEGKIGD